MNSNRTNSTYALTSVDYVTIVITAIDRSYIVVLAFILLLLCFIYRNSQPLKSRRIVPFLFLFCKLLSSPRYLPDGLPLQLYGDNTASLFQGICFYKQWTFPSTVAIFMIFNIAYIRYFLIRIISNRKETKMNSMKEGNRKFDFLNLIQILLRDSSVVILIFIALFVIYIVGAIDLITNRGICRWNDGLFYFFMLGFLVVLCISMIIMLIIDFVYSGYLNKCNKSNFLKQLFYEDDPLLYRLELLSIVVWMAISAIQIIMVSVMVLFGGSSYSQLVLNSSGFFIETFGLIAVPGVVLYHTIKWRKRKRKMERKSSDLDLRVCNPSGGMVKLILEDPELAELFKKFTEREFSVENVLAYVSFSY
jgi:hypothetical protein